MLEQNGVFFFVGNPTWVMNAVLQLVHQKGRLSKDQEEVPETLYLMPDLCMELLTKVSIFVSNTNSRSN